MDGIGLKFKQHDMFTIIALLVIYTNTPCPEKDNKKRKDLGTKQREFDDINWSDNVASMTARICWV